MYRSHDAHTIQHAFGPVSACLSPHIRLLVVDNHFFVRLGLASSLNAEPGLRVVAEADDSAQAIGLFRQHMPDVVIMDADLPGGSYQEALGALHREFAKARVLILSKVARKGDAARALQAGAAGFLAKSAQLQELALAIRTIHAGESYLPPKLSSQLPLRSEGFIVRKTAIASE